MSAKEEGPQAGHEPRTRACPACGQAPGSPCLTPSGSPLGTRSTRSTTPPASPVTGRAAALAARPQKTRPRRPPIVSPPGTGRPQRGPALASKRPTRATAPSRCSSERGSLLATRRARGARTRCGLGYRPAPTTNPTDSVLPDRDPGPYRGRTVGAYTRTVPHRPRAERPRKGRTLGPSGLRSRARSTLLRERSDPAR